MDSIDKSSCIHGISIINTLATAVATVATTTTLYYIIVYTYMYPYIHIYIYIHNITLTTCYTADRLDGPQTFNRRRGFLRKTNHHQSQPSLNSKNPFINPQKSLLTNSTNTGNNTLLRSAYKYIKYIMRLNIISICIILIIYSMHLYSVILSRCTDRYYYFIVRTTNYSILNT